MQYRYFYEYLTHITVVTIDRHENFFCITGTKQAVRTISKCFSDLFSERSLWAELSSLL